MPISSRTSRRASTSTAGGGPARTPTRATIGERGVSRPLGRWCCRRLSNNHHPSMTHCRYPVDLLNVQDPALVGRHYRFVEEVCDVGEMRIGIDDCHSLVHTCGECIDRSSRLRPWASPTNTLEATHCLVTPAPCQSARRPGRPTMTSPMALEKPTLPVQHDEISTEVRANDRQS